MKKFISIILVCLIIFSSSISIAGANSEFNKIKDKFTRIDGVVTELMEKHNVPGVSLSIVKDGSIIYKKGYGFGNLETQTKVDPNKTIFQINSLTKLFTGVAIMKLCEEGELSLDDSIDMYFQDIDNESLHRKDITIFHLMTHTGGFDTGFLGQMDWEYKEKPKSLEEVLTNTPNAIRTPGTIMSYSNYGITALGRIVEKVSGLSIEEYIETKIFEPLEMEHSYYGYDPKMEKNLAEGYLYKNGDLVPKGPVRYHIHPAGFAFSNAHDMGNFMKFLLEGNKNVLSKEYLMKMQKTQFTYDEEMLGNGLIFYERERNGHKVIGHEGDGPTYAAQLSIYPEKNIGFFISINKDDQTSSKFAFRRNFEEKFYELFTENNKENVKIISKPYSKDIKKYFGKYFAVRTPLSSPFKIFRSLTGTLSVSPYNETSIKVSLRGSEYIFKHINKEKFQNSKGGLLVLRSQNDKKYVMLDYLNMLGRYSPLSNGTYEKLTTIESILESFAIYFLAIIFVVSIIYFIFSRWWNKKNEVTRKGRKCIIITRLNIIFMVVISGVFLMILLNVSKINLDIKGLLIAYHVLSYMFLMLNLALIWETVIVVKNRIFNKLGRIVQFTTMIAMLIFLSMIINYNCLNITYLL